MKIIVVVITVIFIVERGQVGRAENRQSFSCPSW